MSVTEELAHKLGQLSGMVVGQQQQLLAQIEELKAENERLRTLVDTAHKVLTWLCVKEVHYDVDVRQAPYLTKAAWEEADKLLAALAATPPAEGV